MIPAARGGVAGLALLVASAATTAGQDVPVTGDEIGVMVQNVVVWVAVNDRRGRPETDLELTDFRILEDGRLQKIDAFELGAQTPLSIQILLDASKSMEISGLLAEARSGIRYLLSRLGKQDQVSLWYFAGRRTHPECPMGTPPVRMLEALEVLRGYGETTLRDSIFESLTTPFGTATSRKAVFLFTDGKDNASRATEEDLAVLAGSLNVPIHAIILNPRPERDIDPSEHDPLKRIVDLSGGLSVIATPFDDKNAIEAIDASIRRLRSSYVLEYTPEGAGRRGFHRIEVKTSCRRCTVLHRQGYYTR